MRVPVGNFNCSCPPGFEGLTCDEEIDACLLSPCVNNATCNTLPFGEFNCSCLEGYTGSLCQTLPPNEPPTVLNPVDTVFATEGQVFQQALPEQIFYDPDSDSDSLSLTLLDFDANPLPNTTWIQLTDDGILEGLPLTDQVTNALITEHVFRLRAEDVGGARADVFIVVLVSPQIPQVVNFLTIFVQGDFVAFSQSLSSKLQLVMSLASHLREEPQLEEVYVENFSAGSVAVTYSNLTIAASDCVMFREWVSTIHSGSAYTQTFINTLRPFQPIRIPTITGPCNSTSTNPTSPGTQTLATLQTDRDPTLLLVILVPTCALALCCLIAGFLAFILYRRRRTERKLLVSTSRQTFLKRRPVILPREIDMPPRRARPVVLPGDAAFRGGLARYARRDVPRPLLEEEGGDIDEPLDVDYEPVPAPIRVLPRPSPEREDLSPEYRLPPLYSYARIHDSHMTET